jgi:hypothetical protein
MASQLMSRWSIFRLSCMVFQLAAISVENIQRTASFSNILNCDLSCSINVSVIAFVYFKRKILFINLFKVISFTVVFARYNTKNTVCNFQISLKIE